MRDSLILLASLGIFLTASAAHAAPVCTDGDGQVPIPTEQAMDCEADGMRCWYWEPPSLDPNAKYPLVIFLHGAGGTGTDDSFAFLQGWSCPFEALFEPANRSAFPAFIMTPRTVNSDNDYSQNPNSAAWAVWDWANKESYDVNTLAESSSAISSIKMLKALQVKYPNIDPERIYVTGISMGGYGTWDFISRHADIFAAGAPSDGGGSPQAAPLLRNMAIWSNHNINDDVPYDSDKAMFSAVARAGGRPYFTEGIEGGHYEGMQRLGQLDYLPWLFAQRRGVPSRPNPLLTMSPEGGQHPSGQLTITIQEAGASEIRYTTDGSIPSTLQDVGTLYAGPFTIDTSAIVIAAAQSGDGPKGITMFHSQPYKLGDAPLPAGADLVPFTPPAGSGGAPNGSGGAANSGGSTQGAGGSAVAVGTGSASAVSSGGTTSGGNAALPGTGGATNSSTVPSPGAPGATGTSGTAPKGRVNSGGGCAMATPGPLGASGSTALALVLLALGLGRYRRRGV